MRLTQGINNVFILQLIQLIAFQRIAKQMGSFSHFNFAIGLLHWFSFPLARDGGFQSIQEQTSHTHTQHQRNYIARTT